MYPNIFLSRRIAYRDAGGPEAVFAGRFFHSKYKTKRFFFSKIRLKTKKRSSTFRGGPIAKFPINLL